MRTVTTESEHGTLRWTHGSLHKNPVIYLGTLDVPERLTNGITTITTYSRHLYMELDNLAFQTVPI